MIIKSKRIYMEDGVHDGGLRIENGRVAEFLERSEGGLTGNDAEKIVDVGENRVIPGIIDTHNHGTCGWDLMDGGSVDTVRSYLKACASQGITGVFPTPSIDMIGKVAEAAGEECEGAQILGIHSEGPWLNRTGEKGIRIGWPKVSMETAEQMLKDSQGLLKLVALAPEIPGMDEIIRYFLDQDVTVAYAHSDCNYEEAKAAYAKGISVATHTGNVMTGLHHRDPGGLGAALLANQVDCEVICDGMHISLDMLKLYFKVKDNSRFMMISDCTAFSGAPEGEYSGLIPGIRIQIKDGFVLTDTGRLMGSSQPVLYGVKNLVEKLRMPMEQALRMSSWNAARKYGFEKRKGSLRVGKDADFVVIDNDYQVLAAYVQGRKVYDREQDHRIFNPEFFKEKTVEEA